MSFSIFTQYQSNQLSASMVPAEPKRPNNTVSPPPSPYPSPSPSPSPSESCKGDDCHPLPEIEGLTFQEYQDIMQEMNSDDSDNDDMSEDDDEDDEDDEVVVHIFFSKVNMDKFNAQKSQFGKIVGETLKKKRIAIPYIYGKDGILRKGQLQLTQIPRGFATDVEKNKFIDDINKTFYMSRNDIKNAWNEIEDTQYVKAQEKKRRAQEKKEQKKLETQEKKLTTMNSEYKLPTSHERESNKRKKERSTSTRTQDKTLAATINTGKKRWSDQKYYFTQYIFRKMIEEQRLSENPIVNDTHRAAKMRIFGIVDESTCVVTGMISSGAGDHMFEINGYAKKTGKHGRYDWWNTIPVVGKWNKRYKKIPVMGPDGPVKIDIGLSLLIGDQVVITEEQLAEATEEQQRLCKMFKDWKEYCIEQEASLYFIFDSKDDEFIAEKKLQYMQMWDLE